MSLRNHTLAGILNPEDVWWEDEFDWQAIEQAHEYSLTGALIIDQAERQAGRRITLVSNANGGWVPRGTVRALHTQRATPNTTPLTLTLADGRIFSVLHDTTREVEATPNRPAADMTDATHYRITLPLIEV
jgi:hypothetical protein